MLTDDPHAAGPTVEQANGHRGYSGADRELIRASRSVPDHFADELVAEHHVLVRVIQRATGRVVDTEVWVVHEVHVRRTDRGAQRSQQQLTRSGLWVRCLADLQPPVSQNNSTQCVAL